jgi:hypothetical protein
MTVADSAIEIGKETEEKSPYDYYDVGPLLEYVLTKGFLYTCGGGPHGNPAKVKAKCSCTFFLLRSPPRSCR